VVFDAQLKVNPDIGSFGAPFVGEASAGAPGAGTVVKLQTLDQLLVPPGFVALTSQ
jgi:hypothetical protein